MLAKITGAFEKHCWYQPFIGKVVDATPEFAALYPADQKPARYSNQTPIMTLYRTQKGEHETGLICSIHVITCIH